MKTVIRDVRSRLFFSGTGVLLGVAFVFSLIATGRDGERKRNTAMSPSLRTIRMSSVFRR